MPPCPFILIIPLVIIEVFSYILKFFSLAIRLSANILAGHTLVFLISQFIVSHILTFFFVSFIFMPLFFAILLLEIGVAFLQAYVFVILVCIYLSDCLNAHSF